MSSLRSSRGHSSISVDRLRLSNTSVSPQSGVLTLSDNGVVGATGTVDINQLTVNGTTFLNNATAVSVAATTISGGAVNVTNTLTAGNISTGAITGSSGNFTAVNAGTIIGTTGTYNSLTSGTVIGTTGTFTTINGGTVVGTTGTFTTINGGTVVGTTGTYNSLTSGTVIGVTGTYNSLTSGTVIGATGTFTAINGGPASFNGNVSVLGADSGRGTTTTDYLSLISHDDTTIATPIWVQDGTLKWNNAQSQTVDILGAAKQMIPGTGTQFTELVPTGNTTLANTADIATLMTNFNNLIQILSANHAFVTYKPATAITMPIQTPQAVTFKAYPISNPTLVSSVTVTFPVNLTQTVEAIVLALNSAFTSNGFPLSATLSGGQVTLTPNSGYSFSWQDGGSIASGFRFSSHIGLGGKDAYTAYHTSQIGSLLPVPQPAIPPTPPTPTLVVGSVTPTTATVSVPPLVGEFSAILYLDGKPIVAIDDSSSPVVWQHTFTGLLPTTTYSITATYVNEYDEGLPSLLPLSITTTAHTAKSIDVFNSTYATNTPYSGPALNGTYVQVLAVDPSFWPTDLTNVTQIDFITLQFKSTVSWDNTSIADARLVLLDKSGTTPIEKAVIYYAYQNRVTVSGSTLLWVGSPDPVPSQGPTSAPAGPGTISSQTHLQALFGKSGFPNIIDKSKPLLFNWFCGYPGLTISNSDVTSFVINYTT